MVTLKLRAWCVVEGVVVKWRLESVVVKWEVESVVVPA